MFSVKVLFGLNCEMIVEEKMPNGYVCCISLGQYFPFGGSTGEPRDNVSVLPICLNKENMGWGSPTTKS